MPPIRTNFRSLRAKQIADRVVAAADSEVGALRRLVGGLRDFAGPAVAAPLTDALDRLDQVCFAHARLLPDELQLLITESDELGARNAELYDQAVAAEQRANAAERRVADLVDGCDAEAAANSEWARQIASRVSPTTFRRIRAAVERAMYAARATATGSDGDQ